MSTYETDVDRHFVDLALQLEEDEVEKGSDVDKTLRRLEKALKKDGFALAPREGEEKAARTTTAVPKSADPEYTVQAFRVSTDLDADAVTSVFGEIDGWKTQTVDLKGRTYVVVTNAPRWSKKRIRTAISSLIQAQKSRASTRT